MTELLVGAKKRSVIGLLISSGVAQVISPAKEVNMSSAEKIFNAALARLSQASEGYRNSELNRASYIAGGIIGAGHMSEQSAVDVLLKQALAIGLLEKEAKSSIESGLRRGQLKPFALSPDDRRAAIKPNANLLKKPKWQAMLPAPPDAPDYHLVRHYSLGTPHEFFEYLDENGLIHFVVARWNSEDGKEIRPLSFGLNERRWTFKRPQRLIPLNMPEIISNPQCKILICEGETAAIAAHNMCEQMVATCGHGGAQQAHVTDWSVLEGRECLILPDDDAASIETWAPAMQKILFNVGATVTLLDGHRFWELAGEDAHE